MSSFKLPSLQTNILHRNSEIQNAYFRLPHCTGSNAESPKPCTSCKSTWCCLKKCQKRDWPLDKILCEDYRTFLATRSSDTHGFHKLGILFPVDEGKPRLQWIPLQMLRLQIKVSSPGETYFRFFTEPVYDTVFSNNRPVTVDICVSWNPRSKFCLHHEVVLVKAKDASDQPLNTSIATFNKPEDTQEFWWGPILLTRRAMIQAREIPDPRTQGLHMEGCESWEDATLSDLHHSVELLQNWPSPENLAGVDE